MHDRPRHGGFTLIELMIVIAILGLLAAVLLPNILGARDAAGESATEGTFLRCENGAENFVRKHGFFPPADLQHPERGKQPQWKPDNGQNTGIESFLAFASLSRSGGTDFSDLAAQLTNTDGDDQGLELALLRRKERLEIADAWGTPLAYFTKYGAAVPQAVTGSDGQSQQVSARRAGDGGLAGAGKWQFLSAGKDRTFGTGDDLAWPRD